MKKVIICQIISAGLIVEAANKSYAHSTYKPYYMQQDQDDPHFVTNKIKHVIVNYLDLFLKKFIGYDEVKADFQLYMLEQKKSEKMKQLARRRSSRNHIIMSKYNPFDAILDLDPIFIWIAVGITICGILICVYFCCNPCASSEEENKEGEDEPPPVEEGSDWTSESGPPDEGCCINCLKGTWDVFKAIGGAFMFVFRAIGNGCSYCWYPTKEGCNNCCNNCHREYNPEEDAAFSGHQ